MEYDVFRGNHSSDEDFKWINELFKQVLKEDKDLCEAAYKNLQSGIFMNGELHPRAENVSSPSNMSHCIVQVLRRYLLL